MGLSGCTCNHILVVAFKEKERKGKERKVTKRIIERFY